MKKIVLILIISLTYSTFAQQSMQWKANYTYKRILDEKQKARRDSLLKSNPAMAGMMKNLYKRIDNRKYLLFFNQFESVFKKKPAMEKPGHQSMIRVNILDDKLLYKNIKTKSFSDKRPLFSETYIVEDSLPDYHWKITGESKQIGKYTVIKATGIETYTKGKDKKETTREITAWFTPEIPVGNGPQKYWGLPGLIMELKSGQDLYLCDGITLNPKDKMEIKAPEGGKKMNEKEYKSEMEKSRKKMEKMYKNRRSSKGEKTIRITL